jgi:hypothetical protein
MIVTSTEILFFPNASHQRHQDFHSKEGRKIALYATTMKHGGFSAETRM